MNKKKSKAIVYYPIFLNLQSKRCVVVGGGKVALRKVRMLLDCGANVTVISPKPNAEIAKLSKERAIHLIQRDYEAGDLKDVEIAIACTDVKEVNRQVADEAKKAGTLINVADDLGLSDFIIPSFFRRGDLTVAVSTAGKSPALSKKIRTKLEKSLREEYASLLSIIGEIRSTIKEKGYRVDAETWEEALDLNLLIRLLQEGKRDRAKTILLRKLKAERENTLREKNVFD